MLRRKVWIGVALGLLGLIGGALIFRAWLFKSPDPVDIDSVIDEFENRTGSSLKVCIYTTPLDSKP